MSYRKANDIHFCFPADFGRAAACRVGNYSTTDLLSRKLNCDAPVNVRRHVACRRSSAGTVDADQCAAIVTSWSRSISPSGANSAMSDSGVWA